MSFSLIEKLKAGKRNVKRTTFPGAGETVGITVLSEAELQEAAFDTERRFKAAGIEVTAMTAGAYQAEFNTQLIARFMVDPEKKRPDGTCEPLFKGADELRQLLTSGAVKDTLVDEYNAWEAECNPLGADPSEAELEQALADLKKNPDGWSSLSTGMQRRLGPYLAFLLATLQKGSGSIS